MTGALKHAALYAQVRSRHASLLSEAAWRELLAQGDVDAIVRRLEGGPYGSGLSRYPAELERQLHAALAAETLAVRVFEWGDTRAVLAAYGRRFELANLKTVLRARHHGLPPERGLAVMIPLPEPSLPWQALLDAPGMESLAAILGGTPYAGPLLAVLEQHGAAAPFTFEVALDLAYFQTLVRRIERLSGSDGRRARLFLGTWIAVENLSWAFRYRRLSGLTPEETVSYTLHRAFGAGLDAVRRVALGATVADEAARLGFSIDPDAPEDEALASLERAAEQSRADAAASLFAGTSFDLGAPLALLALRETEVRDLVTLVEGRAAGLESGALRARLLGPAARGSP